MTIADATGRISSPFEIGTLRDYPKDAPDMLFPEHDQTISETQPTFIWEAFQSIYLDRAIDPLAYEINLEFPTEETFSVPSIVDSNYLVFDSNYIDWTPSQPPDLSSGMYNLTIHSNHQVMNPHFSFEHQRQIQFQVETVSPDIFIVV